MLVSMRSRRMPALFTTTSRPPKVSTAWSTMSLAAAKSLTSAPLTTASPPIAVISSTTCCAGVVSAPVPSRSPPRSFTTTLAPCSASIKAYSRPMPRPAPVTIATRPSHIPLISSPLLGTAGSWHGRGQRVERRVDQCSLVRAVALHELVGRHDVGDLEAALLVEPAHLLGVDGEGDGLTDEAEGARSESAGRAHQAGIVDHGPHVMGDGAARADDLVHRIERALHRRAREVHRHALPGDEGDGAGVEPGGHEHLVERLLLEVHLDPDDVGGWQLSSVLGDGRR